MNFLELSGSRIREEREKLGMSQEAFAAHGGVKRVAQYLYERGSRAPDTRYLNALGTVGVDVTYIVTGVKSGERPNFQSSALLTVDEAVDAFTSTVGFLDSEKSLTGRQKLFRRFVETIVETRQKAQRSASLGPWLDNVAQIRSVPHPIGSS